MSHILIFIQPENAVILCVAEKSARIKTHSHFFLPCCANTPVFVYMTITVKPQQRLSCLSCDDVMIFPPACPGGGRWSWQDGFCKALLQESDRVVLCLGERGEPSCAPERSALFFRRGKKPFWLDPSTTSPATTATRSPCLSSETCASFQANDTIWYASGTVGQDNVFTRSSPQKAISISSPWLFLLLFIKHNNDEVMERLYCSRAKTHYSCQTSEYKRNYKMAFCTRSPQIAGLGDWGREEEREGAWDDLCQFLEWKSDGERA